MTTLSPRSTKGLTHEDLFDGALCFGEALANNHAFAAGKTVGLDDVGRSLLREILKRGNCLGECSRRSRRDIIFLKHFFGESFAAFQLRGGFVWSEYSQTA